MIGFDPSFGFLLCILIFPLASLLVLDLCTVLHHHEQHRDVHTALLSAWSQAKTLGTFGKILQAFPNAGSNRKEDQIIEFILNNRISMLCPLNVIGNSVLMCFTDPTTVLGK